MEHIGNIMDATFGGILLMAITAIGGFLLKATKRTGVARTLIRFIWSGVLLAMCAFFALAAYIIQHGRGFNNGAVFVMYLIGVLTYGVTFVLFNSNWIGSYADKVSATWKHFRDLASPDYTPKAIPVEKDTPPVAHIIASFENIDHNSPEMHIVAKQLKGVGTEAVEPLIEALAHSRTNVRGIAIYVLGQIKDERAIKPLIEQFSKEGTTLTTAQALAEYGLPVIRPLVEATKDTRWRVRDGAVTALNWCHSTRSVEALDELFQEWLEERQKKGEELWELSSKLLDEYSPSLFVNIAPEDRKELLTRRAESTANLRKQAREYHNTQNWWLGGRIAQALSSIASIALKYPPK
jgi:hypothetical protein